ncbi:hypothetical protein VB773_21905 [Haloarculaceae archaeon H-GB2-1]|nr:hypothetical protein [Haloarculaceae archaeon H-GB1-1]MEA5389587.1 hypothetical protein [Haloarculaceae archaeon H-GB11]MEA5409960.1 hypothetical protein [Haloarculaceae archaeon H-GB2-1]
MSRTNAPSTDTRTSNEFSKDGEAAADATAAEASGDQPSPLSLDEIFEVLKNQRRRHVIHHLKDIDDTQVALGDLAEHIAAEENDKSVNALSSGERKRVYVGLYQCHLPKMHDMGIVEFNQDRGIVALGPNVTQLEPYIDPETEDDGLEWHRYYLVLAIVGSSLLGMLQLWGGSAGVGSMLPLGLLVGALAGLSIYHTLYKSDELPAFLE